MNFKNCTQVIHLILPNAVLTSKHGMRYNFQNALKEGNMSVYKGQT